MRTTGMNLPVTRGFIDIIMAGPSQPMTAVTEGDVGPQFFTPEQQAFRNQRKLYGGDDPNAGGYNLAQIDWDKESGRLSVGAMEPTSGGWLGGYPDAPCGDDCECGGC
jgi:hypothetical protein